MNNKTWQFGVVDSLFFGSGKPMNAGESAWIDSQFPPTGLTLQGAIRTAVLYHTGADIDEFISGNPCLPDGRSLIDQIGDAKSLGQLDLTGPFFYRNNELLFPLPLDLMSKLQQHTLLKPASKPISCDLGNIRLPTLEGMGYKVSENCYINYQAMTKLLNGEAHDIELIKLFADDRNDEALADKEPKIGLARDNKTRNSVDGMLFAIAPVRLRQDVSLHVRVKGIKPEHLPQKAFLQRLGGEGKLARICLSDEDIDMPIAKITEKNGKLYFKLVFTQPALMPVDGWLPQSFVHSPEKDCWIGSLASCEVTIISACIGKPVKLGGWDLKSHSSKTTQSYIPAGSVFFCEAQAEHKDKILKLHDTKLGHNCQYGFGHVLVGRW